MSGTMILECFFLYALLLDCEGIKTPLEVPHQVEQAHRLIRAMNARNERSARAGLNHWLHRCDGCFKRVKRADTEEVCKYNSLRKEIVLRSC